MIDREQVLHIARLARLRLTEDEVERMSTELSGILEHVETLGELELDDVEPTTHVDRARERDASRRAGSEPRPREGARRRSRQRRGLLPRSLSAGVSDPRLLTVAEGLGEIAAGNLSADEWFGAYARHARRARRLPVAPRLGRRGPGAGRTTGPLAGVPIAIKDIFCVDGLPATAGSKILEGYIPPYTATAVEHLLEAGARILGKTNMDEFAMGSSNENSAFGDVRNPWDRDRVPGGSSGGSAAVVSGGLAPCSIGTDTGGSIRQPAALCGVVGMKPTYGSISRSGMIAFASSLDQCGPFTRDVRDAALLLGALGGRDDARLDLDRRSRSRSRCRRART